MRRSVLALAALLTGAFALAELRIGPTRIAALRRGETAMPGAYYGDVSVFAAQPPPAAPDFEGLDIWLDAADPTTFTLSGADIVSWRSKGSSTTAFEPTIPPVHGGWPAAADSDNPPARSKAAHALGTVKFSNTGKCYLASRAAVPVGGSTYVLAMRVDGAFTGNLRAPVATTDHVAGFWAARMFDAAWYSANYNDFTYAENKAWINGTQGLGPLGADTMFATVLEAGTARGIASSHVFLSDMLYLSSGRNFVGDIAEFMIFDRHLSVYERRSLELYLAAKWNIDVGAGLAHASTSGLLGWWKLDENAATAVIADSSASGFNGTAAANTAGNSVYAVVDRGQNVNNAGVSLGNVLNFDGSQAFTAACWARGTDMGQLVIGNVDASHSTPGWGLFRWGNKLYLQLNAGTSAGSDELQVYSDDYASMDGGWHHYAATYDGSKSSAGVVLYIDGVASYEGVNFDNLSGAIISSPNPLRIGGHYTTQTSADLSLDDVRVYGSALSAYDVLALFNSYTRVQAAAPGGTITIYFDATGGFSDMSSVTISYGQAYGANGWPSSVYQEGYDFWGWYTDYNGGGSYRSSEDYFYGGSDETVYAYWTVATPPETYTISLDAQGGYVDPSSIGGVSSGAYYEEIGLPSPSYEGYMFNGWYSSVYGTVVGDGDYYTVYADDTLTAQWQQN